MTLGGFARPAGFLAAAVVASLLYLVLPAGGLGEAWIFVLMNSAAAIALWWRVVRGGLRGKLWLLLASAQSLYVLATVAWYPYALASQTVWGFPSPVDYMYWASYLGWGAFLVGITSRRDTEDPGVAWEAIAAGLGLSVVAWRFLVEPAIEAVGLTTAARIASFVYPVLLLMLATLAVRASLLRNRMRHIDVLCVSWVIFELAADVWYSTASASGSFRYGSPWIVLWMLSYGFFGAMVLDPHASRLLQTDGETRATPTKRRALVLGMITTSALAAVGSHAEEGHRLEVALLAVATAASVGLVLFRLAKTSRDLATERSLREELERTHYDLEYAASHDHLTGL
ncbi:MAG: hypothetical protein ACLGHT_12900, partial [Acidimicrobiia bacterium]